jgi:phytoene dehydrogenase-like protein
MISWTTRTDPTLAPAGKNILQITIEGPYKLEGTTWDDVAPKLTEQYINYLSDNYVPGLKDHIDVAFYATPLEY